jgi:ParB family chromosome partitioning protein
LAEQIVNESMSVREVERRTGRKKGKRLVPKRNTPALVDAETYLKRLLGTSVKIVPGLKSGKIEIEYFGDDDLTRLLEMFRKIE